MARDLVLSARLDAAAVADDDDDDDDDDGVLWNLTSLTWASVSVFFIRRELMYGREKQKNQQFGFVRPSKKKKNTKKKTKKNTKNTKKRRSRILKQIYFADDNNKLLKKYSKKSVGLFK